MRVIPKNKKRGAALVEYGLLVAGVALVTAVAISIFGHKVNDMVGTAAAVLPSTDTNDTGTIAGGRIIRTDTDTSGAINLGAGLEQDTMQNTFNVDMDSLITDTPSSGGTQ